MRGQLDYPFFLVLVVLIASGFLVVQVGGKLSFDRDIGSAQAAVIKVNNDVLLFNTFVQGAARQVLQGVLNDERTHPEIFFSSVDADQRCVIANDPSAPKVVVAPNIQARLAEKVTAGLRPYLASYESQSTVKSATASFEVGIQDGSFSILALEPIEFAVIDKDGIQLGKASHRPAFKLDFPHTLNNYVLANEVLSRVASKCSFLPDPVACASTEAPAWSPVALDGGKVRFSAEARQNQPCYILFLPRQEVQEAPQSIT